ncbi:trafficking PGA2-domain-containing protein [Thelonectria olida]|uniref:Trafficking PGA2-domain-containing protein n=1 Tax=Thelonectria olida TaxID=1576542 RepID=A0A9P9ANH3_9HYPO|nr:trafficking PGA2-domain-containing protein [Thelonectria olida]
MDPETQQQQPVDNEQVELNALGKFVAQFLQYGANASNNLSSTFTSLDTKGWLRLIMIVGGYMLLRPYIMKLSTKVAVKKMEEQDAKEKAEAEAKAQISPNELRGIAEQEPELDPEGDGTGADWGQRARVRQRVMLKDMLEAEEQRRLDEESDKELDDLLE